LGELSCSFFYVFVGHKNFYWRHLVCPTIHTHTQAGGTRTHRHRTCALTSFHPFLPLLQLSLSDNFTRMGFLACPRISAFLHCVLPFVLLSSCFLGRGTHTQIYMCICGTLTAEILVNPSIVSEIWRKYNANQLYNYISHSKVFPQIVSA